MIHTMGNGGKRKEERSARYGQPDDKGYRITDHRRSILCSRSASGQAVWL